jgi:hypothetical protein
MTAQEPPRQARRHGEQGAVAVEAALVTPLLLIIVFGIIEVSLLVRDYVAVTSAVRSGARVASAAADAGPGTCEVGPEAPPCTPASSPALAQAAADAIHRSGSALAPDSIEHIMVYKANASGFPGTDANREMPSTCAGMTDCVRFVWRPGADAFRYQEGTWASASINACVNESDTLGVYLQAQHGTVTGIFGDTITIGDKAVMKFEPLPEDSCKPGRPAAHQ